MKKQLLALGLVTVFGLAGCANGSTDEPAPETNEEATTNEEEVQSDQGTNEGTTTGDSAEDTDHSSMNHSSSGDVPDDLQEADSPTFPVGSQAVIEASHMEGMNGAEATISGAFNTTVYTVTYTPTDGGEPVKNHKWVIHEEIKNAQDEPYEAGDEVTLTAKHMEGMEGATATIDSAQQTTVYMVDYTSTTSGEEVTNHKWVTEDELSAK
ncbi:DUF1541 domain-containing protein [Bacillaceae bacterium SIJ1]|uniref:YdhK family protein n=1 Tax=Litoribacterium kuwaitense TaxID=1398745 RepID=UPI0013EDE01F|nr:YdhK family protein [Litoribacterium kuwaitense]NGP45695.1 DUF1541 domain-containing protein [Litoribacterium kuwaitense]